MPGSMISATASVQRTPRGFRRAPSPSEVRGRPQRRDHELLKRERKVLGVGHKAADCRYAAE
jgi:hypothetical protein